ncbi:MAG: hypothetical protein ACO1SX_20850 [Actinomycetota bacterium]
MPNYPTKDDEEARPIDIDHLRKLTDQVGKREQFVYEHGHTWSATEHSRRTVQLKSSHDELERHLADSTYTIRESGWSTTRDGRWHRLGENPPKIRYSPAETHLQALWPKAAALMAERDLEAIGPVLSALEADLGDAGADGDLERLRRLCDEYLAVLSGHLDRGRK